MGNRRQLKKIAHKDNIETTKVFCFMFNIAQICVKIDEIFASDHTNFIDDQVIARGQFLGLFSADLFLLFSNREVACAM